MGLVDFCFLRCYNISVAIRVVFFDCDGTLTRVRSSWEYLHRRLGLWESGAHKYQDLFRQGLIDYEEFCRRDALLWRGMPAASVHEVISEIPYQTDAQGCIEALKARGIYTVMVSTGLSFLVDKVKVELGIDEAFSNDLVVEDGVLTGEIRLSVAHDGKGRVVKDLLALRCLSPEEAAAVGDGEGDRDMFQAVGLAIGFHPHEALAPALGHALFSRSLLPVGDIVDSHG